MKRIENPELDRAIFEHLAHQYNLRRKRPGIHLSTLIYCLTRSWFDQVQDEEVLPTDDEIMLFSLGIGLQNELTPPQATTPVFTEEGIIYSPDMIFKLNDWQVELKTTRSGMKRYVEGEYPETWIEYIKGGCHILQSDTYDLSVFYVSERPIPKIKSETLIFDKSELDNNWEYIRSRKAVYDEALSTHTPPSPFIHCKKWECKSCRYLTVCSALVMQVGRNSNGQSE
jgi:hypothetical protein